MESFRGDVIQCNYYLLAMFARVSIIVGYFLKMNVSTMIWDLGISSYKTETTRTP